MRFHQYAAVLLSALAGSRLASTTPIPDLSEDHPGPSLTAIAAKATHHPHNDPLKLFEMAPCIQKAFAQLWREAGRGQGYEVANDVQAWCDSGEAYGAHYWFTKRLNVIMKDQCGKDGQGTLRQRQKDLVEWGYRTCNRDFGFTVPDRSKHGDK